MGRFTASVFLCAVLAAQGRAQQAAEPQAPGAAGTVAAPSSVAPTPAASAQVGLDDCLASAMAGAPGLRTAKLSLDTASAQLTDAIGSNGLTVGESAGYSYQYPIGYTSSTPTGFSAAGSNGSNVTAGVSLSGPSTSFGVSVQPEFPNPGGVLNLNGQLSKPSLATGVSASLKQTIYDGYPGGRPTGLVKQERYTFQIAQVNYDTALESLSYQVKQDYYTLLGDQKSLIAKDATLKAAEIALSQMQGYLTAGRATSLDVLQFQVALTLAQLDLRSQQNTIDKDRKKLSLDVGWPLAKAYSVADVPSPALPSLDQEQALETAYANRPELKTYDLDVAYAGIDLELQKSQYSPTVSIDGALGLAQDLAPDSLNGGSVSLGATIALPPIYDGKQIASLVREKANAVESYNVQREQERQSITIAVQNDLFSVKDASDRLDLAKETLDEDQGLYDLQRAKFRAGTASSVDVMTAFSNLAAAQVGLETAKSTYNLAILALDNDMGQ
jgi:outer membrane protein TolC